MPPAQDESGGKKAVGIKVKSKDPEENEEGGDKTAPGDREGEAKDAGRKKKGQRGGSKDNDVPEEEELSEEDRLLKEGLELAVTRSSDVEPGVQKNALEHLSKEIRSATTSMTSVPRPLKFLRPHYETLQKVYDNIKHGATGGLAEENRKLLADILSVLAMTMAPGTRASLEYKLAGNKNELGQWGQEYLRSLAGQIGQEYTARMTKGEKDSAAAGGGDAMDLAEPDVSDLLVLVDEIVPFHLRHNAEAEAVDLLVEVQRLSQLVDMEEIDEGNYQRVCLYLLRMADYMSDIDDLTMMLKAAFDIYEKQKKPCDALRMALRMGDADKVASVMEGCSNDPSTLKQMGILLARHRSSYESSDDELSEIIGNLKLSENFLSLAKDLDVMDPKTPEDIYKTHLAEGAGFSRRRDAGGQQVDSARANLASTLVNAFVNAGYCVDSLMSTSNAWLYKNKDHGIMTAAASLGMIFLWNVEEGLTQIDKYLYSNEDYIKAGAALAVGIVSSGVRNESDPALALLSEHIEGSSAIMRIAAAVGLGIAYAGTGREDVMELLTPLIADSDNGSAAEVGIASLSLGLIFVGSCNENVGSVLAQRLMEASDTELNQSLTRFVSLGLGLLFLGKQDQVDAMIEVVRTIEHHVGKYTEVVLESCAYAGTGNVLMVQKMLHLCAEHLEEKSDFQMAAVLGIALVTLGDDIGSEMALRTYDHLLHYGEHSIKKAVPMALALLNISNPDISVIDQLSRLTHDANPEVAQTAIVGLGLVSAGTNNSKVAQLLRQLSEFYSREPGQLFCTRIAQGLNHMGKGLLTLHPFHSDRVILCPAALGGILAMLHACLDLENTLLDKYHYIMYYLCCAINPRMLLTVDEELKPLPVSVRVGQAVETVGQAGRPKTITGFQTHKTPVLLGVKDRAELATAEYISSSDVLEGVVILRPNPEYEPETAEKQQKPVHYSAE